MSSTDRFLKSAREAHRSGRLAEAEDLYRKVVADRPDDAETWVALGNACLLLGKHRDARECFERAHEISPKPYLPFRSAFALPIVYESEEELTESRQQFIEKLRALLSDPPKVDDPLARLAGPAFYLAYQGHNDRDLQAAIAQTYAKSAPSLLYVAPHCRPDALRTTPAAQAKIRVGFISRFFWNHTIALFNGGLIRKLARDRFHVTVFRFPGNDDESARFISRGADETVVLPENLSNARSDIAERQLDALFYTDLGMDSATYFLAFARLAHVQCVTWGHPVTTGIPSIDYFLSSTNLEPDGAESHYTERLVKLENLPTYYHRPQPLTSPKTRRDFGLPDDATIYLCAQNLFKFHPDFDAMLGAILRGDPKGLLVLVAGKHQHWMDILKRRFARSFPESTHRVAVAARLPYEKFHHLLNVADVMLDTLHFGGGNTAFESFSLGKPIVTLPGRYLRGRVTSACYRRMGITDCVARDRDDYVRIAVKLGTDAAYRAQVEAKIRARSGVLYEQLGAVREIEAFLQSAVARARDAAGRRSFTAAETEWHRRSA